MPLSAVKPAPLPSDTESLRTLANQAFSRTAGAPLVEGNAVRVLRDATENYPEWERAMREARRSIHIEMYIFHRDRVGRRFVALLAERARAGVEVRLVYDWFGCGFGPAFSLFSPLIAAGGPGAALQPAGDPAALGRLRRNHRKLIVIDAASRSSAVCIGQAWEGRPDKGQEPWRDTAIEIVGPAVAYAEAAFAESWRLTGGHAHHRSTPGRAGAEPASPTPEAPPAAGAIAATLPTTGTVSLRLIPTEPFAANLLRLDLLVASLARTSLWISDAYFIGTGSYLEALKRAAADGVDVRLLLPQGSDVGWIARVALALSPAAEAGVRIFEWNGTMMHAKTPSPTRVGRASDRRTNINSWLGNWELDVAIEDATVSQTLEEHYLADLERASEIVLKTYRLRPRPRRPPGLAAPPSRRHRSARRVVRTVTDVSRSIGAAVTGNRQLEDFEVMPVVAVAVLLAAIAALGFLAPRALAWPLAIIAAWAALTFVIEAVQLWRKH